MKKKLMIGLILSMILTGCGENQIDSTESIKNETTSSVKESNDKIEIASTEVDTVISSEETENKSEKDNIIVTASDKINYAQDVSNGRYQDFVEIVTTVQNNTDKDIKGIQGIYHIKDMFGEKIIDANFDITSEIIPVGQTVTINDYGFNINSFMEEQKKLFDTAYDSLIFEYEITQIIFTDGSTKKIPPQKKLRGLLLTFFIILWYTIFYPLFYYNP